MDRDFQKMLRLHKQFDSLDIKRSLMGLGIFIGFIMGSLHSYFFLLPINVLEFGIAAITIGDVLRIFVALLVTGIYTSIGGLIGSLLKQKI